MRRAARWVLALCSLPGCSSLDLYPVTRETSGSSTGGSAGGTEGGSSSSASGGRALEGGAGGNALGGGGAVSAVCTKTAPAPGDTTRSLDVGGRTRSYVLHVPPAYDGSAPAPLVLDFHALGATGQSTRSSSPYPPVLDPEGVVMAFPDGLRGPAGTAWNVGPCCVEDVDDVAFARAVVEDVRAELCIDASRVYAVGVLTGGGMVHYLACHAADVFAAVAPAAFDLLAENVEACAPSRPVTSISFRGNGPSRVPYEGGPSSLVPGMPLTFLGARETAETWARLNGCAGTASAANADGCTAYADCMAGAEVILCTKQGGREDPGEPRIAWPVLARHRLE